MSALRVHEDSFAARALIGAPECDADQGGPCPHCMGSGFVEVPDVQAAANDPMTWSNGYREIPCVYCNDEGEGS